MSWINLLEWWLNIYFHAPSKPSSTLAAFTPNSLVAYPPSRMKNHGRPSLLHPRSQFEEIISLQQKLADRITHKYIQPKGYDQRICVMLFHPCTRHLQRCEPRLGWGAGRKRQVQIKTLTLTFSSLIGVAQKNGNSMRGSPWMLTYNTSERS